jgi:hypothetical protein
MNVVLLDQAKCERVAVRAASVDLRESNDREDDVEYPESEREDPQKTDDSAAVVVARRDRDSNDDAADDRDKDLQDDPATDEGDLPVQCLLGLDAHLGTAVLEDQEDDEGREDVEDAAKVGKARPELVVCLGEGSRGRGCCVSHCVVAFPVNEVVVPSREGIALCRAVAATPGTRGVREHTAKVALSRASMQ